MVMQRVANQFQFLLILIFCALCLRCSFSSEQKVKWAPKFGLKLFNAPSTMGTLPINMQSKTKFPGSIFPSRQPLMQDSHRDLFLNDPMLHIAQFLKDGASDVKKELVSSYKIVAGARNNYERIEKVVDVIVSHKRAVAIGIICGAGLYSRVVISPEKRALDTLKQARLQEISKWGRKLGRG